MNWKPIAAGITAEGVGFLLFRIAYSISLNQESATMLDNAVIILYVSATVSLGLVFYGILKKGPLSINQASGLVFGAFATSLVSLILAIEEGISYGDDQAACGVTDVGSSLSRCKIFFGAPWLAMVYYLYLTGIAISAIVIIACVVTLRRRSMLPQASTSVRLF